MRKQPAIGRKGADFPMNMLFVTQFFPAPGGKGHTGGTISNLNLLRALGERHEVTVLSFDPSSHAVDFANEPFTVMSRPSPAWRAPGILRHWLPFVRKEVGDFVQREGEPNVLLSTTSSLAAFDVVSDRVSRMAIVRAFENFGAICAWVPVRSRIQLGKLAILRRLQDRRLMTSADAVLTNSRFMRGAIRDRFAMPEARIHILPQQVDVAPLSELPRDGIIGFVHRGPDKNIALVMKLAELAPDLEFRIFGHEEGLPSAPPPNVVLVGWSSDRNAMFGSAALWLVPSLWAEPFGRVSIEAQAANRPVLVANRGGLPETVIDPRFQMSGYAPQDWMERIRQLLDLPDSLVEENGARIRSMFSKPRHDQVVEEMIIRIRNAKEA